MPDRNGDNDKKKHHIMLELLSDDQALGVNFRSHRNDMGKIDRIIIAHTYSSHTVYTQN